MKVGYWRWQKSRYQQMFKKETAEAMHKVPWTCKLFHSLHCIEKIAHSLI